MKLTKFGLLIEASRVVSGLPLSQTLLRREGSFSWALGGTRLAARSEGEYRPWNGRCTCSSMLSEKFARHPLSIAADSPSRRRTGKCPNQRRHSVHAQIDSQTSPPLPLSESSVSLLRGRASSGITIQTSEKPVPLQQAQPRLVWKVGTSACGSLGETFLEGTW